MCLAIPARVVEINDNEVAIVELGGVKKDISLALGEGVVVGDYVIVHVGFALSRVDEDEAHKVFEYLKEMEELAELGDGKAGP